MGFLNGFVTCALLALCILAAVTGPIWLSLVLAFAAGCTLFNGIADSRKEGGK